MTTVVNAQTKQVPIDSLEPHPANPRIGNVDAIAASIEVNGFYGALVVQRSTNRILAGNHRWQAARKAGMTKVPVIFVDVDDDHALKILLADNKTSDDSTYDDRALTDLLREVSTLDGTGWTPADLDGLIAKVAIPDSTEPGESRGLGTPIISYSLVFDDDDQQQVWFRYMRWLRATYPNAETNAERLATHLATVVDG